MARSAANGHVFDLVPEIANRYGEHRVGTTLEIWKFNRQVSCMAAGGTLRIQADAPFRLHWSLKEREPVHDSPSQLTGIGPEFVDLQVPAGQRSPVRFTFFWTDVGRWEVETFRSQ
jgi:glucoamylase